MLRRAYSIFGLLLIAVGLSLPVYVVCVFDYSDQELKPFDVVADLSGRETRAEFTSSRNAGYRAAVAIAVPRDAAQDSQDKHTYACLLRSPKSDNLDGYCHTLGRVEVYSWTLANIEHQRPYDWSSYPVLGYDSFGGEDLAVRELFFFDTAPGRHYVVIARIKSDDLVLKRLKPRLIAYPSDAALYDSQAVAFLLALTGMTMCLSIGIFLALAGFRRKCSASVS